MNQQELSQLISENLTHLAASYWSDLAHRLEDYRRWAMGRVRDPEQLAIFAAVIHALLQKLGGRLKKKFDETVDGLAFSLEEGQLLLNGINVHAFIQMAQKNPTQKAKIFLKGLKNRLGILLSNRLGNPSYERIRDVAEELFSQIDVELAKTANDIIYLPPTSS